MQYYVSTLAPFTEIDKIAIQTLAGQTELTVLFINETFTVFQTALYFKQINKELGFELQYQQCALTEVLTLTIDDTYVFTQELASYLPDTAQVIERQLIHGYEQTPFAGHHIFDDISETMAQYLVKNEMYGITKQIGLVFNAMSYYRFQHTMRVVYRMMQLADLYEQIDTDTAYLAALFHDYAKELPIIEQQMIVEKYFSTYADSPKAVWHGFAGAVLLQQMDDQIPDDLYEAIAFHPIGIPNYPELGLALYIADFCEFGRSFKEEWEPIWLAAQTNLKQAAAMKIAAITAHFADTPGKTLYWTTENMLQWLQEELKKTENKK